MPRHKKSVTLPPRHSNNGETSSSASSETSVGRTTFHRLSGWKTIIGFGCLLVAVYVGTLGYLETRVNTPFDDAKVVKESGLAVPERYWGTYRPGVYFGFKSREPKSPVFGLMWYELAVATHKGIRHWCDQNDKLPSYGWVRHDGVSFGEQFISDPPHEIVTSFVKTPGGQHGGHWIARVNVTSKSKSSGPFVLIWYAAFEDAGKGDPNMRMWLEGSEIKGYTPQLDYFKLSLSMHKGEILHKSQSEAYSPGLHLLKEKFYSLLKLEKNPKFGNIAVLSADEELGEKDKDINFIPTQLIVETPFVLDIVFTTEDLPNPPVQGEQYTALLEEKKKEFDRQFEEKFKLKEKGYSEIDIAISRSALASMVGGIGYFYGASRVRSHYTTEPVPYWRASLYSAVPSRSFFPRGFLWDEGFHGLLLGRWNPDIQMDIAAHWIDLVNVEGWIPREQILGTEALARVPKEFVVQSNLAANPPMLLIQLAHFIRVKPELFLPGSRHRDTLDRMYTRLQAWYNWFQTSQKGEEPTSYRWRGREDDGAQLNPKSLSSGLDDYPRASHPSDIERHVDLRCWMYAAADSMASIANLLQRDSAKYEATRDQLGDEDLLNELHWSTHTHSYADYGLHTDGVRLVKVKPKTPQEKPRVVRSVSVPPQPKLVTSAFGYVSLFPMLLKVLKPESANLGKIMENLDKPDLLWSPYGLRSLSKSSPLFMKRNTEHDPPYWRGQIWINMNYLALASLRHYSYAPGPYMDRARELYAKLKTNVVANILTQYKKSGYLFEQYSSTDGTGSGCKPFTGWTALLPLIMADLY